MTATRTERAVDTLGSAVTVLGEQQVERSGARLVMELLEQVPGPYYDFRPFYPFISR